MKVLKLSLLCTFVLISVSVFAQDGFQRNPDGSVSITTKGDPIYTDAEGKVTTKENQDKFLEKNDKYRKRVSVKEGVMSVFIEKIYPDEKDVIGKTLPTLTYKDVKGREVKILEKGKLYLLSFWDVNCGNCIIELNVLNAIAFEFPEIQIVAITPEKLSDVVKFMKERKLLWNNITVITDYQNDYLETIQTKVFPTSVLVSKSGIIEKVYFGMKIRQTIVDMDFLAVAQKIRNDLIDQMFL